MSAQPLPDVVTVTLTRGTAAVVAHALLVQTRRARNVARAHREDGHHGLADIVDDNAVRLAIAHHDLDQALAATRRHETEGVTP